MGAKEFIAAERERYSQTRPGEDYDAIHGKRDREMLAEERKSNTMVAAVSIGIMLALAALVAVSSNEKGEKAAQEVDHGAMNANQKVKFVPTGEGTYRVELDSTSMEDAKAAVAAFAVKHPNAKVSDFKIDSKSGKISVDVTEK